jgi:uncharacterized membrane protein YfcA
MTILANAGGLGGGGIIIPFMMIFFSLPIKECVPLANFFGLIASFTRFVLNFKQRHPRQKERLVIDYEIVSLTMPILYLGTLFGVKIGTILSDVQVAISLSIVLLYMSYTSFKKSMTLWKNENIAKAR